MLFTAGTELHATGAMLHTVGAELHATGAELHATGAYFLQQMHSCKLQVQIQVCIIQVYRYEWVPVNHQTQITLSFKKTQTFKKKKCYIN